MALALGLAACVPEPPPRTADEASRRACRARAESVYTQENRGAAYLPSLSDTPYAAGGLPGDTTAGLSARYGYDTVVQDCLRGSEANTEIGAGSPAAAFAAPPAGSQRPAGAAPLAAPAPGAPLSAPPP
jgi:hypothetical protein